MGVGGFILSGLVLGKLLCLLVADPQAHHSNRSPAMILASLRVGVILLRRRLSVSVVGVRVVV